jgi:NAD(P)-dependent dehydrogenase (short-subunit alcohol dehydrogenase family)
MADTLILITGATDGIGKQSALELAAKGNSLIIHGRNEDKTVETAHWLTEKTGNTNINYYIADFADLAQVRDTAKRIRENIDKLDVLINNAGIYMNKREVTKNGYETQFAVNHLAPVLLTMELLPVLKATPKSRIVNVASKAHYRADFDFENINGEKHYDGYEAYANSKLANILFTYELAERLTGDDVTVNCLHPGVIETKLLREGFGGGGDSLEKGAETIVYLALSDDVNNVTGKYFDECKEAVSSPASHNDDIRKRLWKVSLSMTGVKH